MTDRKTDEAAPDVHYQFVAVNGSAQIIAFPIPKADATVAVTEQVWPVTAASTIIAHDET